MTTLTTRAANRLVLLIGVKRRLAALAEATDLGERDRFLAKIRRTDRPEPPWRLRRMWTHSPIDVGGFPMHLLARREAASERVILYLHGGGYMFGPFGTEWAASSRVAKGAGCDLAVLVYPKAPEYEAPQSIEVVLSAYDELERRYGPGNIAVVGTSAGGGLALAMMVRLRDASRRMPELAVLWSPGVDMTLRADVSHLEADDVLLTVAHVRMAGGLFAGDLGASHPDVSPTFGDLSGLPPLHVFAGTAEILYPSLETFVQKANDAGTTAHLIVGEGQQHTWPAAPTPEGRRALRQTVGIIRNS